MAARKGAVTATARSAISGSAAQGARPAASGKPTGTASQEARSAVSKGAKTAVACDAGHRKEPSRLRAMEWVAGKTVERGETPGSAVKGLVGGGQVGGEGGGAWPRFAKQGKVLPNQVKN